MAIKAKEFIANRQKAYKNVFSKENGFSKDVLADLARFCRANESTFHPDARLHAVAEGRREVWLRITQHLELNIDDLYKKFNGKGDINE